MVLLLAVGLGIAVGWALGGRLSRLADLRLRAMWLFYTAIGLQIVAFPSQTLPWSVGDRLAIGLWLASYGCLVVAAACNLRVKGAAIVGLGMASNLVAVLANGGHMPGLPVGASRGRPHLHGVAQQRGRREPSAPGVAGRPLGRAALDPRRERVLGRRRPDRRRRRRDGLGGDGRAPAPRRPAAASAAARDGPRGRPDLDAVAPVQPSAGGCGRRACPSASSRRASGSATLSRAHGGTGS